MLVVPMVHDQQGAWSVLLPKTTRLTSSLRDEDLDLEMSETLPRKVVIIEHHPVCTEANRSWRMYYCRRLYLLPYKACSFRLKLLVTCKATPD